MTKTMPIAILASLLALCACERGGGERAPSDADTTGARDIETVDDGSLDTEAHEIVDEVLDSETVETDIADEPSEPALRVLFIGNSYTFFNDLPRVVGDILEATLGRPVAVDAVTQGGARLADHWSGAAARERIESGAFDTVVLQGQSVETVVGTADFQAHAERFAEALQGAGADGVWFANWARRDLEADPDVLWRSIEEQYEIAAARNGDTVARVGAAWEIALLTMPDVELFISDLSHPSPAGSLLAACVIAEAIADADPVRPADVTLGLDADVADALCAIAEGGVPCDPAESLCDGGCVPWSTSDCGGCGVTCAEGDPCRDGVCGCDAGLSACDGTCVRLGTFSHCAACGDECSPGRRCVDGSCACPEHGRIVVYDRFAALTDLVPDCDPNGTSQSVPCAEAAHRFCTHDGCFGSGFIAFGHAPRPNAVMCTPAERVDTTFAALAAREPGCTGEDVATSPACATAIHRLCAEGPATTGFGPVGIAETEVTVSCIGDADLLTVALDELSTHTSRCSPDAASCSAAAWNYCESQGYSAGFGPVETEDGDGEVVCLD